jgi:hypothetical protein
VRNNSTVKTALYEKEKEAKKRRKRSRKMVI